MINVIFAFIATFLFLATALVMAVDGAIVFAFIALFASFASMVIGLTYALLKGI